MKTAEMYIEENVPRKEGVFNRIYDNISVAKAINKAREDAIRECAERADIHYPAANNLNPCVDKESILNLIKEVK